MSVQFNSVQLRRSVSAFTLHVVRPFVSLYIIYSDILTALISTALISTTVLYTNRRSREMFEAQPRGPSHVSLVVVAWQKLAV